MKTKIYQIRIIGLLFLATFVVPILDWVFIFSKFASNEAPLTIVNTIADNDFLLRLGIVMHIFSAALIIIFSVLLYSLLKYQNKKTALLALLIRFIEAILIVCIAFGYFAALIILKDQSLVNIINNNTLTALLAVVFNRYVYLSAFLGIFFGLSMLLNFILLYRSKYLPDLIVGFGITAYSIVVLYDTFQILCPDLAAHKVIMIAGTLPVLIIQILTGLWFIRSK